VAKTLIEENQKLPLPNLVIYPQVGNQGCK